MGLGWGNGNIWPSLKIFMQCSELTGLGGSEMVTEERARKGRRA